MHPEKRETQDLFHAPVLGWSGVWRLSPCHQRRSCHDFNSVLEQGSPSLLICFGMSWPTAFSPMLTGPSYDLGLCGDTSWFLNSWFHLTRETSEKEAHVCNVAKPKSHKPQDKKILFLTQKTFNQRQFWNTRCVVIWSWASSRTFRWCVWVFVSSLHLITV